MTDGNRDFTPHERAVLHFLIRDSAPDAEVLRAQIAAARFVSPWFEGSSSFDFVVAEVAPRLDGTGPITGAGAMVFSSAHDRSDDTFVGEIFLWKQDGLANSLEFWWITEEMPDALPPLSDLQHHEDRK